METSTSFVYIHNVNEEMYPLEGGSVQEMRNAILETPHNVVLPASVCYETNELFFFLFFMLLRVILSTYIVLLHSGILERRGGARIGENKVPVWK